MNQRLCKRIISLLLALQMFCAPLAYALEERPVGERDTAPAEETVQPGPVEDLERPDTEATPAEEPPAEDLPNGEPPIEEPPIEEPPTGEPGAKEEEPAAPAPAPLAADRGPYGTVRLGHGYQKHLTDMGERFRIEREDGNEDGVTSLALSQGGDGLWYAPFLSAAELGRVPDLAFEGWYVWPNAGMVDDNSYYDEAAPVNWPRLAADTPLSEESTGVPSTYMLNAVGRWVPSGETRGRSAGFYAVTLGEDGAAAVDAQPLPLYLEAVAGKTPEELEALKTQGTTFVDSQRVYYLRVPAEVEAVDLSFAAWEPYLGFEAEYQAAGETIPDPAASPVRVTVTTGDDGAPASAAADYTSRLSYEIVNGGTLHQEPDGDWWAPDNSCLAPAHSRWTLTGGDQLSGYIPLTPSAGSGRYYNVVQIWVTAPDGSEDSYTFYIQRLADPVMALAPGNTPAGMVERDTASVWGAGEADIRAAKDETLAYFDTYHRFPFGTSHWPVDAAHNNSGRIYKGAYSNLAWPTVDGSYVNRDLDPAALVLYQDSRFQEPGLTLYDSQGDRVDFGAQGAGAYRDALERTLALREADTLGPDSAVSGAGTLKYYGNGGLQSGETRETVSDGGGQDLIDLAGERVCPGVYELTYTFTDPISGRVYDSQGSGFYRGEPEGFRRAVLVLPIPGDVDMDGAVTAADGILLRRIVEQGSGGLLGLESVDPAAALYLYRTCDVNGDGRIDSADVEKLLSGWSPAVSNASNASDYHYLPLPMGEEPARLPAPDTAEPEDSGRGKLSLEYLGRNTEAVTQGTVKPTELIPGDEGLTLGDVFWVGVRLSDATFDKNELFKTFVSAFTCTVTYDARYVTPVSVLSQEDLDSLRNNGALGDEAKEWAYSMRKYNVGTASATCWGNDAFELTVGSRPDREYTTHYSKALPTLGADGTGELKELVLSIDLKPGKSPLAFAFDGDTWLMAVPFRFTSHPYGPGGAAAQGRFMELGMGMRELLFVTRSNRAGVSAFAAGGDGFTAAWSMQDEIFGGSTRNAQDAIQYRGGSAMSLKLGQDQTSYEVLRNEAAGSAAGEDAVYGQPFENVGHVPYNAAYTALPPGLSYTGSTISGMPTRAGTFTFYIGGKPYQITVEQAPLTLTAVDQRRYYGEESYCGVNSAGLSFTYDPDQIMPPDLGRGITPTGAMDELPALLGADAGDTGYTPPTRAVYVDSEQGELAVRGTAAGEHPIILAGASATNYRFSYVDGTLDILPRPIEVGALTVDSVGTVYHDGSGFLTGLGALWAPPDREEFTVVRAGALPTDRPDQYNGLPLSDFGALEGDSLSILYDARFVRTASDLAADTTFAVAPGATELRQVSIEKVRLVSTERSGNYALKGDVPRSPASRGYVTERALTGIGVVSFQNYARTYRYGETLNLSGALGVELIYGTGQDARREYLSYSSQDFTRAGLNLTWVTGEELDAGGTGAPAADRAYHGQQLHVKEHSGRYLCVWKSWTDSVTGETVTVSASTRDLGAEARVTVTPRPLTLTVTDQDRYYGEENAPPAFTYEIADLAPWDRKPDQGQTGAMGELEAGGLVALRDYTPPAMAQVTALTGGAAVERTTRVTNTYCYITLTGGGASDYTFLYTRHDGVREDSVGPEGGWGTLMIHKRPIIVQNIANTPVGTIYADTHTPGLSGLKLVCGGGDDASDTFDARLPVGSCYPASTVLPEAVPITMGLTGDAILSGDRLGLTYEAAFLPDRADYPYFDLKGAGEKACPVKVSALRLDGDYVDTGCYTLVYSRPGDAVYGYPSVRDNTTYASATGTVRLRPITGLAITGLPNMTYTYGDQLTLGGMSLRAEFETTFENDARNNVSVKNVTYGLVSQGVTTFDQLGLKVYYSDGAALSADPILDVGEYPTVGAHSGKLLVISGQVPGADAPAVTSAPGPTALTIHKKPLKLTVQPQFRFYGESNGAYLFQVKRADLAQPDQSLFRQDAITGTASALDTPVAAEETGLGLLPGYTGPSFHSGAGPASPARTAGYPLTLTGGGADNYTYQYQNAAITVLPRPLVIDKVTKVPIYTVFPSTTSSSAVKSFATEVTWGAGKAEYTPARPAGGSYTDADVQAVTGTGDKLPVTGEPIRNGDHLTLGLTVVFDPYPVENDLPVGEIERDWNVKVRDMVLRGEAAANYRLVYSTAAAAGDLAPTDPAARARVDRREIESIEILEAPDLTGFTYGDALDLSALRIRITYVKMAGETSPKVEEVGYNQRDNVYVTYWPASAGGGPKPLPTEPGQFASVANGRRAATGDHLTIAPVHDDPSFAHNGMYLAVSARTHKDLPFVQPRLASPDPIAVAPLELDYTLTAENKTYDGSPAARGSITLENAYDRGGITDVVYVVTGADYEDRGPDQAAYTAFRAHVAREGYTFASGTEGMAFTFLYPNVRYEDAGHTAAHPALPGADYWLTEQGAKSPDEPGWDSWGRVAPMPVEVTNMVLSGPDAANYTWKSGDESQRAATQVLRDTRDRAENGQDAVPYAAIEKAPRPDIPALAGRPTLELDRHTNAVRVTLPQDMTALAPEWEDDYGGELHLEYALDYLETGAGEPGFQLAGPDVYQDGPFFGGEPVEVPLPDGYVPSEPVTPPREDEEPKGQLYAWAAEDAGFGLDGEGRPLRAPLPRDAVLWSRVRLAETHNYLASAPIYSLDTDTPPGADSPVLAAAAAAAEEAARAEREAMEAESAQRPDKDGKDPAPVPAAAVKSYTQRLDVISSEEKSGADTQRYRVDTLESVWFTDVLTYPKKEILDNVLRNYDPSRYYDYYWDAGHSARLEFEPGALDLSAPIPGIEVERKGADGSTVTETVTVNENGVAVLYVSTSGGGGSILERSIRIVPHRLDVPLGSEPVHLEVVFDPPATTINSIRWSSSDPKVAGVDNLGYVTFRSVGVAFITATSYNGMTDQITVRVSDPKTWIDPRAGVFNFYQDAPYFTLEPGGRFEPDRLLTRGELAIVLARFYQENKGWTASGAGSFPDVKETDPWAGAARLLGQKGILTGVEGGLFAADQTATRAEFITILCRMMNLKVPDTAGEPHAFRDSGEGDTWAYAYIDAMAGYGIAQGTGDGEFSPHRPITRAEAAAFLSRLLRAYQPPDWQPTLIPADVPADHWGYQEILQAINGMDPRNKTAKRH